MPRLVRPDASKPRLLNLRVYESHNERAAGKKVEMFMPNLTYLSLTIVLWGRSSKEVWSLSAVPGSAR
jgi:hypothetical protein